MNSGNWTRIVKIAEYYSEQHKKFTITLIITHANTYLWMFKKSFILPQKCEVM